MRLLLGVKQHASVVGSKAACVCCWEKSNMRLLLGVKQHASVVGSKEACVCCWE